MPDWKRHISQDDFERLYEEYKPRFKTIAQSYIRNEMVVEDIVTDSFLYFWEHRDALEIRSGIPAYILGTVKHGCLEWLRTMKNRLSIQQRIHTTAYAGIQARISALEACDPERIFASEIQSIIQSEIDRMPPLMRQIFLASRYEGKTYREIAQETGMSERNVKATIQKSLERMRTALSDYLPLWGGGNRALLQARRIIKKFTIFLRKFI